MVLLAADRRLARRIDVAIDARRRDTIQACGENKGKATGRKVCSSRALVIVAVVMVPGCTLRTHRLAVRRVVARGKPRSSHL